MCCIVSGSFGTDCFIRIPWELATLAGITSSSPSKISYAEMRDCCILAEALVQAEPPPSHRHLPAPTRRPRPFLNLRYVQLNAGWSGKAKTPCDICVECKQEFKARKSIRCSKTVVETFYISVTHCSSDRGQCYFGNKRGQEAAACRARVTQPNVPHDFLICNQTADLRRHPKTRFRQI